VIFSEKAFGFLNNMASKVTISRCLEQSSIEPLDKELISDATSAINIFINFIDFWDDACELPGARPIPQNDHQQHRDEAGADPQGDVSDGFADRRGGS